MSDPTGVSRFSAADPAVGYLYQVRSALLWALQRLKSAPDFLVSVETLDDVTFEATGGNTADLLQTKHHRKGTASLTDASPDLWKTLRVWFEGYLSAQIPVIANLYLVTTGTAPEGTATSRLRSTARDVVAAQKALDATAASSSSKTNKSAYEVYLKATAAERSAVLGRVVVIDAAPTVADLDGALRQEVFWAAGKEHHAAFLERLEGWWFRRVVRQLAGTAQDRIGSVELEAQMADLREQFKREALPIDEDILAFVLDEATHAAYGDYAFVKQLELVRVRKTRVVLAIQDFYRAYTQRSRWLRDDLVIDLELHKYESRLVEEWTRVFEAMRDELGDEATDDAKAKAGRTVLKWADEAEILIRPGVTEPFVSRGSLHMLSDKTKIGWHPEFADRLAALLGAKVSGT